MKHLKLFFCMILVLGLFSGVFAQGTADWVYTYDCDTLPNVSGAIQKIGGGIGSFFLSNDNPNVVFLNGDGTLTINDFNDSGNHYCTVDVASGMWSVPATVEVRMAMLQTTTGNSVPLRVSDGENSYEWRIFPTYLSGARSVTMDMTQMRVLRIKFDSTGAYLYVDNDGTIEEVLGYYRSLSLNYFFWGDMYSDASGEYVFDYIYWLTGAAYDFDTQINKVSANECGYWGYLDSDLNKDCKVDLGDLAIMVQEWLGCTDPADAECVVVD